MDLAAMAAIEDPVVSVDLAADLPVVAEDLAVLAVAALRAADRQEDSKIIKSDNIKIIRLIIL